MLGGVIFDFDGVIVDSHPTHIQSWKTFLYSKGKAVSEAELAFVREGAKRGEILRHFLGELTPEQVVSYGAEKDKLFQARAIELKLVRGFAEFLYQLDAIGLPSAVASSGSRARVERTLETFSLRNRFGAVVTGNDVPRGKPYKSSQVTYWYVKMLLPAYLRPRERECSVWASLPTEGNPCWSKPALTWL